MAELRQELTCDVRDVGRNARELASPMYYIRRFPWMSMAAAAAVGYLLIPKKKQVIQPDPEMLSELIRKQQIKLDTPKPDDSRGLLQSLAVMGLTWALKTGVSYATQQFAAAMAAKAQQHSAETPPDVMAQEEHPPAPSPLEEPWNTPR